MKKYAITFAAAFLIIITISILYKCTVNKDTVTLENKSTQESYTISSLDLPDNIDFAGEEAPLDLFYVKESLDKELLINTYWHSSTLLYYKRASRYFPVIEPILEKNKVPNDFKYIALIESGFENVVSPKGAAGFWQFRKGAAEEFGLEINNEVDERYHLEKATEAACKYFLDAYEKYGSWTMAAASYNAGKRGIDRQIEKQKEDNYYDLLLYDETERYVFRVLAMKSIFLDPEKYGFFIQEEHLYPPIGTYDMQVDTAVSNWADFAKQFDLTYRILKEFNPWLRQAYLKNPRGKTYNIKIPKKEELEY